MIEAQPSMIFHSSDCADIPAEVSISCFERQGGAGEHHLIVRPTEYGSIDSQLEWVSSAYQHALGSVGLDHGTCVFRRFFCSDLTNQASVLEEHPFANPQDSDEPCAVSWVCQPPGPPAKVVLWAYHMSDPGGALDKGRQGSSLLLTRGSLTHVWTTGVTCTDVDMPYGQTEGILDAYEQTLQPDGLRLADHVIAGFFSRMVISAVRALIPST